MKKEIYVSETLMVFLMSRELLEPFGYNYRHKTGGESVVICDDIWNAFEFDRTPEGYNFWAQLAADFKFI